MEIWIIGIVIVALMVYASTKIKKNAAKAFEREVIETDEFCVTKPEGLMHPLRERSEFAFEAFSKSFGNGDLRNFWQVNAELFVHGGKTLEDVCEEVKRSSETIAAEEILKDTPLDQRICLMEGEQIIDEVKKLVFWKIVENVPRKKVFEFRVFVLEKHLPDFISRIEEMIESFRVK